MEFKYNKNAALYYKSAKELFLPVEIIHGIHGFTFRLGKKTYFFREFDTPFNNSSSAKIAEHKYCANQVLKRAGIPVPKATAIHSSQFNNGRLESIISHLTFPLVIKPTLGSLGRHVYCNIPDIHQLKILMAQLFPISEWISIEEFHGKLNSYRVLMFKKRVIGVVQRYPAHVIGDGTHTITELIDLANAKRAQLTDEFVPIVVDEEYQLRLNELGITLNYIPAEHERVVLCYTCNASRGGTYEALSTKICKKNRQLLVNLMSLLNLDIAGIDMECIDINTPIMDSNGVIIEVNTSPSVRIHENQHSVKINRVTKKIVRSLIYRHPLSFAYVLYKNRPTSTYVRMGLFLIFLSIIYKFIAH